jgi:hypothetical protein
MPHLVRCHTSGPAQAARPSAVSSASTFIALDAAQRSFAADFKKSASILGLEQSEWEARHFLDCAKQVGADLVHGLDGQVRGRCVMKRISNERR